jgi:hypothetical protein
MNLTSAGQVTFVQGSTFIGTAVGSGRVQFKWTIDGTVIGSIVEKAFVDGEQVEHSWPDYATGLTEGPHDLHWRAQVVLGTGTIEVAPEKGRAWILTRGAVGVGLSNNPNAFVSEALEWFYEPITDEYAVELIMEPMGEHGVDAWEEELPDVVAEITARFIVPFIVGNPVFGVIDGPGQIT